MHYSCKLTDAVNPWGEVTHGSAPHLRLEQHYTTVDGGSNINREFVCAHSRPACTISSSSVWGSSALPTWEQEDHGVTSACTDCTFSTAECCRLSTLAVRRSGESSLNTLPTVQAQENGLGQGLHGSRAAGRLGGWVGRSSMHGDTLPDGPISLTSSALIYPLGPDPCIAPMHPEHCWTPMITPPMLLHSTSSMVMPLLQGTKTLSTPLSTWQATSSSTLLSHQSRQGET